MNKIYSPKGISVSELDELENLKSSWGVDTSSSATTAEISDLDPTKELKEDILEHIHQKRAENPYTKEVGFSKNGGDIHTADIKSDPDIINKMDEAWFGEDLNDELSNKLALKNQRGGY